MKVTDLDIFVIPALCITEIKEYIERNYGRFHIIYQNFEYSNTLDKWRIIVDMKPNSSCPFIVSLRSHWLCSSLFYEEHNNIKHFIANIDEKPF